MSDELKLARCPFCGGEAALWHFENVSHYVVCTDCNAGIDTVASKAEAIADWNRRAPEPMTSVVKWVRYDGTPETFPEYERSILMQFTMSNGEKDVCPAYTSERFYEDSERLKVGGLWAYFPTPPEGME